MSLDGEHLHISNGSNEESSVSSSSTSEETVSSGHVGDRDMTQDSNIHTSDPRDCGLGGTVRHRRPMPPPDTHSIVLEIGSTNSTISSCTLSFLYSPSFPLDYNGYINMSTMDIPNEGSAEGVRVKYDLLRPNDTSYEAPLLDLINGLYKDCSPKRRPQIIKLLQVDRLPYYARHKMPREISECLKVDDHAVQKNACSHLEELILQLQRSNDDSVTESMLKAAEMSMTVLRTKRNDDDQVQNLCSLHLMAVAAIFTRCKKPDLERCSSFILSSKDTNKSINGGMKQVVFKSLRHFYEQFSDEVEELSSFPVWTRLASSQAECNKFKDKASRASFFKLVLYSFSLLNGVARKGWRPVSIELLAILKSLYQAAVVGSGKQKMSQECRSMFDFFLVRGLVVLLNTTFVEDKESVGDSQNEHPERISELITEVIVNCKYGTEYRQRLLREVRGPTFHKVTRVRQTFNILHRTDETHLKDLAHGHIEQSLRGFGFWFDDTRRAKGKDDNCVQEMCNWFTSPCKLSGTKADCTMYVPTINCIMKEDFNIGTCLKKHPVHESAAISMRHKRNLDLLQQLSPKSEHVLKLLAYQYKPFPFYITEAVEEEDRLLSYLRLLRREGYWLSIETMIKILLQITDILILLEKDGLVTRDLTCYNLVVREKSRSRSRNSRREVLRAREEFTIQLADLSLIDEYRNDENICVVRDHGPVPVRWTAPEALFEGRYSPKSATWALGCVMYEIATYGCEPYTSYSSMTTEEILKKMKLEPGSIRLFRWPFIHTRLCSLIEKCTSWEPEDRPSFEEIKQELSSIQGADSSIELPLEQALAMEARYPTPSNSQLKRGHVPEKGIPVSVQQLIDARKSSELYKNTRVVSWHCEPKTAIQGGELFTYDSIDMEIKNDKTIVKEKLCEKFVNCELRLIESSKLPVKCWNDGEQGLVRLTQNDGQHVHEREYQGSWTLKSLAARGDFWSEDDDYDSASGQPLARCLHVVKSVADAMCQLHRQEWLFRDFRVSNILVNYNTGEAVLARIGRMRHLRAAEDSVHEEPFQDSWRRLAPEVLVAHTYSRANDVFMFGTMIWELFHIREESRINPRATAEDMEPCADIPRHEVINYIREGMSLPNHESCPVWLYELILQCRHPNPLQRPTAEQIVETLARNSSNTASIGPLMFKPLASAVPEDALSEETDELPDVPARNRISGSLAYIRKHLPSKKIWTRGTTIRRSYKRTTKKHKEGIDNRTFLNENENHRGSERAANRNITSPLTDHEMPYLRLGQCSKHSRGSLERSRSREQKAIKRTPSSNVTMSDLEKNERSEQKSQLTSKRRPEKRPKNNLSSPRDTEQTFVKQFMDVEEDSDDHYDTLNNSQATGYFPGDIGHTCTEPRHDSLYNRLPEGARSAPISPDVKKEFTGVKGHTLSVIHETGRTTPESPSRQEMVTRRHVNKKTTHRKVPFHIPNCNRETEYKFYEPVELALPPSSGGSSSLDQHSQDIQFENVHNSDENYDKLNERDQLSDHCTNAETDYTSLVCTSVTTISSESEPHQQEQDQNSPDAGCSHHTSFLWPDHTQTSKSRLDYVYVDGRSEKKTEPENITLNKQRQLEEMEQQSSSVEYSGSSVASSSASWVSSESEDYSSIDASCQCCKESFCQECSEHLTTRWTVHTEQQQQLQQQCMAVCMDNDPLRCKLLCPHKTETLKNKSVVERRHRLEGDAFFLESNTLSPKFNNPHLPKVSHVDWENGKMEQFFLEDFDGSGNKAEIYV